MAEEEPTRGSLGSNSELAKLSRGKRTGQVHKGSCREDRVLWYSAGDDKAGERSDSITIEWDRASKRKGSIGDYKAG